LENILKFGYISKWRLKNFIQLFSDLCHQTLYIFWTIIVDAQAFLFKLAQKFSIGRICGMNGRFSSIGTYSI
jgi:hypothetical protein